MLTTTPKMVVHLCDGTTELRKSFKGLSALVKIKMKANPLSGHLFVFTNRTHTRVKAYYWDGTGEVIAIKASRRHVPLAGEGAVIDNNPVERGIRPIALGRKNWLFVGHPDAGWIASVIYSVVGNCKLLKLDPEAYLNWVLRSSLLPPTTPRQVSCRTTARPLSKNSGRSLSRENVSCELMVTCIPRVAYNRISYLSCCLKFRARNSDQHDEQQE